VGLAVAALATGCGDGDPVAPVPDDGSPTVATYELPSQLPNCNFVRRHEVFYVSSEDQFYVCEGGVMTPIGVGDGPSLIRTADEPPGETCPAGGHLIEVGLDQDGDDVLDDEEVTDSDVACNPLTILAGSLNLTTQEEVDLLAGVFWIAGDLTLVGDLDLSALSSIQRIDGHLAIEQNSTFSDLDFLSGLVSLKGSLTLTDADALTNVDALSGLDALPGRLELRSNDALANVDGLAGITSISGTLELTSNPALTNIDGLSGLASVGGFLLVNDNDALTNVAGLNALASVAGFLGITDNDALVDLDGLGSLTSLTGNLAVSSNDALTSIDGLSGVTSAGTLSFEGNASLTNLAGLGALEEVVTFFLFDTALPNLDDLASLATVHELLFINANQALTSVQGMTSLEEVGTLLIHNHPNLPPCDIDALVARIDVLGSTSIFNNTGSGTCDP
jgi:hypothetical protein